MKKSLPALLLLLFLSTHQFINAALPAEAGSETIGNEWQTATVDNGIKASFRETVSGPYRYLDLKFENQSGSQVNFSWKVTDAKGKIIAESGQITLQNHASLDPQSDVTLTNGSLSVLVPEGLLLSSLNITIHPAK